MRRALMILGAWLALMLWAASYAAAQRMTIQPVRDTALRLFCTYRSASGAAVNRPVAWIMDPPGVVAIVPVVGTTGMRYVWVRPAGSATGFWPCISLHSAQ